MSLRAQIDLYPYDIFDMDGTLLNSEIWHHEAWNQMVSEFGMPRLSTEQLYSYGGLPTLEISRRICELNHVQADLEAMSKRKTELYVTKYMYKAEPFPEICELLKELSASGKRVAIATSSHYKESSFLLEKHGILPYVHALITGDQVHKGKPNPEIYLLAAQKLGAKVEECLVFEDTVVGMAGVKNAKMSAVKVFAGHFDCDHVIPYTEEWAPK